VIGQNCWNAADDTDAKFVPSGRIWVMKLFEAAVVVSEKTSVPVPKLVLGGGTHVMAPQMLVSPAELTTVEMVVAVRLP
jgi:hypothetical protein